MNDKYYSLVYKWFDYMEDKYDNRVCGYVIMPNHLHLLLKITDKSPTLPTLIQNAKRFLAYSIIKLLKEDKYFSVLDFFQENARIKFKAKHKVFEDGYDCLIIQTQKFFLEKVNYIHNNPCQEKWRLVESPEDYKYSSAANYILGQGQYNIEIVGF